jgi:hypothetical protein
VTLRTAQVVIGVQAVIIAGLIGLILWSTPRSDGAREVRDRSATEREPAEDLGSPAPRRTSSRATTRAEDSRAAINPKPFVESEDVAFSPDDPVGIMLYGKVTTADGKAPKEGVYVSMEDDETGEWLGSEVKSGAYAISGLRPGAWNLVSRNAGYRELRQSVRLSADRPRQRLDLVIQPCAIVKVKLLTPEGRLLNEALVAEKLDWSIYIGVVATIAPPTGDLPMTPYGGYDDFGVGILRGGRQLGGDVPKGYSGVLELREGPPVYVSAVMRHVVLETKLVPAGATEVEIVVPVASVKSKLATLKLRLVDADTGDPIVKARVEATDRQSGGASYPIDEKGNILKEGLRPGLLHFSIHAEGHEDLSQYIRLEPGQINDLGTIRLSRAVSIEGVVVDERGEPVPASLAYRNLDRIDFPQPFEVGMSHRVEPDGTFKIGGVGRGRGIVVAETKERAMAALAVDTTAGSVTNARIVIKAGTRVVLEPKLGRTEQYLAQLVDEGGTIWLSHYIGEWVDRLFLPPGTYTLRIYDDKALRRAIPIVVGSTPLRVPVTL